MNENHFGPFQGDQSETISNEREKLLLRPSYDLRSDTLFNTDNDAFNS